MLRSILLLYEVLEGLLESGSQKSLKFSHAAHLNKKVLIQTMLGCNNSRHGGIVGNLQRIM
jgi:hypothetical protein